jgi:hypothetical protein
MSKPVKVALAVAAIFGSFWAGQLSQGAADERGLATLDSLNALAPTVNPVLAQTIPNARRQL